NSPPSAPEMIAKMLPLRIQLARSVRCFHRAKKSPRRTPLAMIAMPYKMNPDALGSVERYPSHAQYKVSPTADKISGVKPNNKKVVCENRASPALGRSITMYSTAMANRAADAGRRYFDGSCGITVINL